jgi:hypothetical protein
LTCDVSPSGNAQGDCYSQEPSPVERWGFAGYLDFSLYFFIAVLGIVIVAAMVSSVYFKSQNLAVPSESPDCEYAMELIGDDSVYKFLLGKNILGWLVALATLVAQCWILLIFVAAAEIDLTADTSDLAYTWFCPRDNVECRDTGDLTKNGWLAFGVLMAAYVSKDIINGVKLVVLSGKRRNHFHRRIRFFTSGTLYFSVSVFTLYASIIYNMAIATR